MKDSDREVKRDDQMLRALVEKGLGVYADCMDYMIADETYRARVLRQPPSEVVRRGLW